MNDDLLLRIEIKKGIENNFFWDCYVYYADTIIICALFLFNASFRVIMHMKYFLCLMSIQFLAIIEA